MANASATVLPDVNGYIFDKLYLIYKVQYRITKVSQEYEKIFHKLSKITIIPVTNGTIV